MSNETTAPDFRTHILIAGMFASIAFPGAALLPDPAFAASGETGAADMTPPFATLDADSNGALTEREWKASSSASTMSDDIAAAHFSMYDIDANGSVSAEEYDRVNEEVPGGNEDRAI